VNKIEFDTKELSPWADINICLNNMRNLTIKAGGDVYEGSAVLTEQDGHVTIEVKHKRRGRKARPEGGEED